MDTVRLTCPEALAPYFAKYGFVPAGGGGGQRDMALDIRLVIREIP